MNLGGVRVSSNPDLFWRSSMSGLDGFRLGDYSSTESRPTVQGRNARTKFGVVSFWHAWSPAFRRHRVGESNACGLADAPPAEAGTTYRNTGSSDFRGSEAKMRTAGCLKRSACRQEEIRHTPRDNLT